MPDNYSGGNFLHWASIKALLQVYFSVLSHQPYNAGQIAHGQISGNQVFYFVQNW
jgi:hypothetical protein